MERTTMIKAMRASISNVLETMFFQMVQTVEDSYNLQDWFPQGQSLLGATLNFDGPLPGAFYFLIPVEMANEITANFLGSNVDDVDEEQRRDTIKEALNMFGGGILSVMDQKGAFNLGLPGLIETDDLTRDKLAEYQQDVILFEAGDYRLAAGIVKV